jgi:hypothetical protein
MAGYISKKSLSARGRQYLQQCEDKEEMPTLGGLAQALGYASREEMERQRRAYLEAGDQKGKVLTVLRGRVEEATLAAVYRKDTAAGAKFVLQSMFGYKEQEAPLGNRVIRVRLRDKEEDGEEKKEG